MYTVKEAARITGLAGHAVRFYTDKGRVPGLRREGNNYRLFDDEAINGPHGDVFGSPAAEVRLGAARS